MEALVYKENPLKVPLENIPVVPYDLFASQVTRLLSDLSAHCLAYFAFPFQGGLLFPGFIAHDQDHTIHVLAHFLTDRGTPLTSMTPEVPALHVFEREITENHGVVFSGHPWLKGVRFPHDRWDPHMTMAHYPFFSISGGEVHEIGVGPVHAGVIEPGHFRFICNGEKVLHLEIQLGYQHRGVESLFLTAGPLKRCLLSESVAGDTAVGHALAHAGLTECLAGFEPDKALRLERSTALELERMAIHIGDTAALCMDVAYQLGQVVNESIRTMVINTTQQWCGNRFGKGLIRPGGSRYPLDDKMNRLIVGNLQQVMDRFIPMSERIYSMPSVLARFDGIGKVSLEQLLRIGAVGMAAKMGGLARDVRFSHPSLSMMKLDGSAVTMPGGDVLARALLRRNEAEQSSEMIISLLGERMNCVTQVRDPQPGLELTPDHIALHTVEGWRGEIVHVAVTDRLGKLRYYKVNDPSLHNWMALALAVRDQEISDFPVCNKSFNLSYCGHDL